MRSPQPAPCPTLSALYKSARPQAFLFGESVTLSPVILSCCACCSDHKSMLGENWAVKAAAETTSAAPTFNPAAPDYNDLARRLGQSTAIQRSHDLDIKCDQLNKQLTGLAGDAKEAKQQELAEAQQQLTDSKIALTALQASFEQDPLSLVPWVSALFALADSGCSTFDAGGGGWPPSQQLTAPLSELLGPSGAAAAAGGPAAISSWLYGGSERVLGAFKRRYEAERGPGRVSIFTRLALHCFGEDSPAELAAAVEGAVERSRQAVLGPEAAAAGTQLDLVQLHWMDYKERDFLPVLLELARLARPRCQAEDGEPGGMVVVEQPRVAAIGLVQPPPEAITAALCAGVPLACVTVTYNLLDVTAEPVIQLCRGRGIKVFADGALAHGLISEAFLGVARPDIQRGNGEANSGSSSASGGGSVEAVGPDNLVAGLNMVARFGGWARFQELLQCIKFIADKHKVSMEVVAVRWLIDQGLFPVVGARWSADAGPWATFGHTHGLPKEPAAAEEAGGVRFVPGVDAALFQVASFLDGDDVAAIQALSQGAGQ